MHVVHACSACNGNDSSERMSNVLRRRLAHCCAILETVCVHVGPCSVCVCLLYTVRCIHGDRNVIIKIAFRGPHFLNFFNDFTQLGYHNGGRKRCGPEQNRW